MSSTNRSNARGEHISDYYVTPQSCIKEFLSEFLIDEKIERPDRLLWLDPCAGGDDSHAMSYPEVIEKELGVDIVDTIDIRQDSRAEKKEDYLLDNSQDFYEERYKYDVIITNPPFNIAREIIEKALEDVKEGGYVVMLLRLNFFGSKSRKDLWDKQMPKYAYVHHKRISFTDDNKTDSIEYMHAVWQKGHFPKFTKLQLI